MNKQRNRNNQRGFSVLELMVVLAIIMIVTAIVLSSFPSFRDNISIDLVASQVATIIREGQIYGVSQKQFGSGENLAYGMSFSPGKKFYLFANETVASEGDYDYMDDSERQAGREFLLPGDITISSIRGLNQATPLTRADVVFNRIYPEPKFSVWDSCGAGETPCNGNFSYIEVALTSDRLNRTKLVQIWRNGQIATANSSSP